MIEGVDVDTARSGIGARILFAAAPPALLAGLSVNVASCLSESWPVLLVLGTGLVASSLGMLALGNRLARRASKAGHGAMGHPTP
jgi:hypothetical protein